MVSHIVRRGSTRQGQGAHGPAATASHIDRDIVEGCERPGPGGLRSYAATSLRDAAPVAFSIRAMKAWTLAYFGAISRSMTV